MNQFLLQQGVSQELLLFPYILEFGAKKNQQILLNSLRIEKKISIRFYYINEGKFEWQINNQCYTLYPGDAALIMPGCLFGSEKDLLDIGSITWLDIQLEKFSSSGRMIAGSWSHLSEEESNTIGKILSLSSRPILASLQEAGKLLLLLQKELVNQEIGYQSRVGQIADELLILAARQLTRQHNTFRDFPKTFTKLEQTLRGNLSHQWTVAEMAALVGLGTTAFTEKVKSYTGFSPLNYLINIRISEAVKLLKRADVNLTDIALDTGFYSSQHFSTTFKKLTGYKPSQFRKNMTQDQ